MIIATVEPWVEAPLKRFMQDTPMYGLERVEGSIHDTRSVPKLLEKQGDRPFNLASWSLPWPWPTRLRSGSAVPVPTGSWYSSTSCIAVKGP